MSPKQGRWLAGGGGARGGAGGKEVAARLSALAACCLLQRVLFLCMQQRRQPLSALLFSWPCTQTCCPWPLVGAGEQLGGRHASPFTTGKTTAMAVPARPSARGRPRAADSVAIVVQSVVGKNRAAEALGSRWPSQTGHGLKTEALVVFAAALIRNKNALCSWLIGHIDPLLNG